MRTVIYGGSFDPVHKGHEEIINNLAERFDEVIVMPTYVSPFKKGMKAAPASLRLAMLKACDFAPNVTISDFEIEKGECSYSIDTVRHFTSPERELYFAIGSEGARTLGKWKCADELKRLCKFYVIRRPGYDKSELDGVIYADFGGRDISSSEVKVALALGKTDLISPKVAEIIRDNGLYDDFNYIADAFATFGMKPERIEHTYRATVEGIKLAKRYDVDIRDVTTALLLHDIGKYVTPQKLTELGIPVPDCGDLPEVCRHAEYGAAICEYYYKMPRNIVEAVRTHTTGGMNMDALGEIVALADYIEPGRKFSGIGKVRKAATISLSLAVEKMLGGTIEYLKGSGKQIAGITERVYNKYVQINKGKI